MAEELSKRERCLRWLRKHGLDHTLAEFNEKTKVDIASSQYSGCKKQIRGEKGIPQPDTSSRRQAGSASETLRAWFDEDSSRLEVTYTDYKKGRKKKVSSSLFSHIKAEKRKESGLTNEQRRAPVRSHKTRKASTNGANPLNGLAKLGSMAKTVLERTSYASVSFELLDNGKLRVSTREVREESFDV